MNWRAASSVILFNTQVRNVLMMKRGPTAKFMPNTFVFPGGLVDTLDSSFPQQLSNYSDVDSQPIALEGYPEDYPLRIAALRELFEEAGILLTFDDREKTSKLVTEKDDPGLAEWRAKIVENPSKFAELFSKTSQADVALLVPWSNWLTPFGYNKRFDTMFFVAPITQDIDYDEIKYCKNEMSEAEWSSASKIIEKSAGNCETSLPPPQFYELARIRLAQHCSLLDYANPTRIVPQLVDIVDDDSLRCIFLPGDFFYDELEAEMCNVRKMKLKDILPGKDIDNFHPFHRMTYRIKPVPYTGHELHVLNLKKMPYKIHLFYYAGDESLP